MRSIRLAVTACLLAGLSVLGACSTTQFTSFQSGLTKASAAVSKYAPIVGKDLVMVANMLVQIECSPALSAASNVATNILTITAPNGSNAAAAASILNTNQQIAGQLCPLYSAIKAQIGSIPPGKPTQVVPAPGS